jgi:dCTP deaminase
MILTGPEIAREISLKRITISPYSSTYIEPNSYGFHLASHFICYDEPIVDPHKKSKENHFTITPEGYCLEPKKFYLASTLETMGSPFYAATLYARRSTSTMGVWIQFSAPLGHTGAIIPWTLEITVSHPVIVYPNMLIGKIAFWKSLGVPISYDGKYSGSTDVVSSRLSFEQQREEIPNKEEVFNDFNGARNY